MMNNIIQEEKREQRKKYQREYKRRYRIEHPEKVKLQHKSWYLRHPFYTREVYRKRRVILQENEQQLKREVLTHYGNGKLECVGCGFSDMRALSIDHINAKGGEHRQKIKGHSYYWLRLNGYPGGYQTLCMNCQWIKRHEGKECTGRLDLKERTIEGAGEEVTD